MTNKEIWVIVEILVLLPSSFLFVTVFHELAHCVAVWVQGGKVLKFKVRWNLTGSMMYRVSPSVNDMIVGLAPLIAAVILAATFVALAFIHPPMLVLAVFEFEDVLGWLHEYVSRTPHSDGGDYRRLAEDRASAKGEGA